MPWLPVPIGVTLHTGGGVGGGIVPTGTREAVFQQIYDVFVLLGTLVGVVVVGYMLYTAYAYRAGREDDGDYDVERPQLGEAPSGGGGGKKLALSLTLSAIIVVSLIGWTYGTLLFVEGGAAAEADNPLEVQVEGYQFGWQFVYPNGHTSSTLRVPVDRHVQLTVTSTDVFHNFGIPELRVKTDAIPGHNTSTWFRATETREYTAHCYELCGTGHSLMNADVVAMEPAAYSEWYNTTGEAR
jgi:cytochrome c oxidase subunit 2